MKVLKKAISNFIGISVWRVFKVDKLIKSILAPKQLDGIKTLLGWIVIGGSAVAASIDPTFVIPASLLAFGKFILGVGVIDKVDKITQALAQKKK